MPKRKPRSRKSKSKRLKAELVGLLSFQDVMAEANAASAYGGKVYRHELDGSYSIADPEEIFGSPDGSRFLITGWR
jgi:hypothetical protein